MSARRKLLFVDRDGTLIEEPTDQQVDSYAKFRLVPGVIPALLRLRDAGYAFVMVTNQDGLGTPSFPQAAFEGPQALRPFEVGQREGGSAEAILVGDHDEFEAGVAQAQQRRDHAGHQPELGERVDLLVRRFLQQHAVAVEEDDARHGRAASRRARSSGEPIEMRSASPRPAKARMSRTTTPFASRRSKTRCASSNRASTKLPSDG